MKKKRKYKIPDVIRCANCERVLTSDYASFRLYPKDDAPKDKIHRFCDLHTPPYCVLCTCGHWTINDHSLAIKGDDHD